MEEAFSAGYDPALELVIHSTKMRHLAEREKQKRVGLGLNLEDSEPRTQSLRRKEQDVVDPILKGTEVGHYYVLLGAKVMQHPSPSCRRISSTFTLGYGENNDDY